MAHTAAQDSSPQIDPKQPQAQRWERSSDPLFAAYLVWETTLTGKHQSKSYSFSRIHRVAYSQAALQYRYEAGRDVPRWWRPAATDRLEQSGEKVVRIDAEIARIQVGLCIDEGGRVWAALREMVRESNSGGVVAKKGLRQRLAAWGVVYTTQHLCSILRVYDGLYWNRDKKHLFVRSPRHVAKGLVRRCVERRRLELIQTNQPGGRDMYLPLAGNLECWRGHVYAGWIAYREDPSISRAVLAMLFGRDEDTLRRWEQTRLASLVQVVERRAQCGFDAQQVPIPAHAQSYVARVKNQESGNYELKAGIYWRLPNNYRVSGIEQHPHRGQGRKVRAAFKQAIAEQPIEVKADGQQRPVRVYFETPDALKRHLKKHGWDSRRYRYLFRGENKAGILMYEPRLGVLCPDRDTYPNERAAPRQAALWHKQRRCRYRTYIRQKAVEGLDKKEYFCGVL